MGLGADPEDSLAGEGQAVCDSESDFDYRNKSQPVEPPAGAALGALEDSTRLATRTSELESFEGMRMKRFSSVLCLNDNRQQQQLGERPRKAAANTSGTPIGRQREPKKSLLAPEDPALAAARQRRPSVGNQSSVNVDQQGE